MRVWIGLHISVFIQNVIKNEIHFTERDRYTIFPEILSPHLIFLKNRTLPFPALAASRQDTLSSTRRLLLSFQWTACVCRCVKGFHRQTHGCAFLEYRETKLYGPVLPHKSYCQKINKWKTRERLIVADLFKVNKMVCMYSFP